MKNYETFRNHPLINAIAKNKKWTVSDKNKKPIDMHQLITFNKVSGALYSNKFSLVTLDEVHNTIPLSVNYAYYLDILSDHFMVLDIEPKCPNNIKNAIINIPCIYKELSLSGKGIHMVFPMLNDLFTQYPDTEQKSVMKNKNGYYEIMLAHYITFTGKQLQYNPIKTGHDIEPFMKIYDHEAKNVVNYDYERINIDKIPQMTTDRDKHVINEILNLLNRPNAYTKSLSDFADDCSRYEFSFINWLCYRLKHYIIPNTTIIPEFQNYEPYTDEQLAWLLYIGSKEYLPYRAKHETTRHGLPWLYDQSIEVISRQKGGV